LYVLLSFAAVAYAGILDWLWSGCGDDPRCAHWNEHPRQTLVLWIVSIGFVLGAAAIAWSFRRADKSE
jgi:hypothetical protein